ncbi:MAG: hypothetical protein QOE45_232 [Frankiaceae bacterium]|jgi:uncharacterized membrane protein HdeD (DUF308 family)|nr:hypothetical protein [Frankiaceae bacterium]
MSSDLRTTPHMNDTAVSRGSSTARTLTIIGFVCAAVAVFFAPVVFGVGAIVLGIVAYRKGDHLGMWAAIAGVVGMVAGIALVAAILNSRT